MLRFFLFCLAVRVSEGKTFFKSSDNQTILINVMLDAAPLFIDKHISYKYMYFPVIQGRSWQTE